MLLDYKQEVMNIIASTRPRWMIGLLKHDDLKAAFEQNVDPGAFAIHFLREYDLKTNATFAPPYIVARGAANFLIKDASGKTVASVPINNRTDQATASASLAGWIVQTLNKTSERF